ncbi:uncharacterized protein [Eurosta solidaginis]|uniref:uncharacterized protein n=1 Tax=Eurosta solidaginis TaxID=178769 RepID=UPI0035315708
MADNNIKHLFLCLSVMIALAVSVTANTVEIKPCLLMCQDEEDPVWATDGEYCSGYRNNCFFMNENCLRQNRGEQELSVIDRGDCQKSCNFRCTRQFDPVCGEYNGRNRTFSTQCVMGVHICITGETYNFIRKGDCAYTELEA